MKHTPECGCILNINCPKHRATDDLLEACKLALDEFEVYERATVTASKLREAIAKAEGGES